MSSIPAIRIRDCTFAYDGRPVLENVDLTVEHADFLAVLGPNGGGKSTLLKIILGLLEPDRGSVEIYGITPDHAGGIVGYLPQHTHVSPSFPITALDAAAMGLLKPGFMGAGGFRTRKNDRAKAMEALERVNMADFANRRLIGLSGGQRQRVLIARAIIDHPRLLLLDEPDAGLDQASKQSLLELLAELNRDTTIVLVSHDITAVSRSVKSVACVSTTLHFHAAPKITREMVQAAYGTPEEASCPVELVAHGPIPHRVLEEHED